MGLLSSSGAQASQCGDSLEAEQTLGHKGSVAAALGLQSVESAVVVQRLSCSVAYRIKPVSPALVDGFLTTGSPGKPLIHYYYL